MADHTNSGDHDERYYTQTQLNTSLDGKVDKVTGKGLSTEDYTSTEKIKLAGIKKAPRSTSAPTLAWAVRATTAA